MSTSSVSTNSFISFSNTITTTTGIITGINKITLCTFVLSLTSSLNYDKSTIHTSKSVSININTNVKIKFISIRYKNKE